MSTPAIEANYLLTKSVDLERVLAFSGGALSPSGWPKQNIHTSLEVAKKTGISEPVISGHQVEAYVVSAMVKEFGSDWWAHGSLRIKFVRPVAIGETLTIKRKVDDSEDKSEDDTVQVEVIGDERGVACIAQASLRSRSESESLCAALRDQRMPAIKERIDQSQLSVGDRYSPYEFTVSKVLNDQYLFAMEDYDPRYFGLSGPVDACTVHPSALLNTANITKSASHYALPGSHSMFAQDQLAFFSPARVNEPLRVDCFVTEVYEKRGRSWHSVEAVIRGPRDQPVLRRVTTGALQTSRTPIA